MARMTHKDLLNTPDEFVSTTSSALLWIKEHPSQFAVSALIIVTLLAGGYGFYYWKTSRESSGMLAYIKAADNSQQTLKVAQDFSDTKGGKLAKLRLARMAYEQGDRKMAMAHGDEFLNNWGKKDTFYWQAAIILAELYGDQREYAKSMALLDDCIANAPSDLKDQALFLKAGALAATGKDKEARQLLSAVSKNSQELAKIMASSLSGTGSAGMNVQQ